MIQVQANDPEVEEFKRKTGYDYVHRRFKVSDTRNSVGDRGSMRYRELENAVVCGTIRVSHHDMTSRCSRGEVVSKSLVPARNRFRPLHCGC